MKSKTLALLVMAMAFAALFAVNAQAKSRKIRMEMTGCLQQGTQPNTFVLNNITNGSTRRNQTGEFPLALARAEDVVLVPKSDDSKLQKHIGQKVKVFGYASGDRSIDYPMTTTTIYENGVTPPSATTTTTTATVNASEFKVTKIRKISGSCP